MLEKKIQMDLTALAIHHLLQRQILATTVAGAE
jgi:hypothetical protein